MQDLFFERTSAKGTQYAEIRYSPITYGDSCIIRVADAAPEIVSGRDDVADAVAQRVAALTNQGYKPTPKPGLPPIQSPEVIARITGHAVPARYRAFLAEGPHANGTVDGITGFADGIPIVFDDPIIPFWLKRFGWDKNARNAIPIAIVEEGRALSIDVKTGAIYVYDNSASKPHVHCFDSLDELLANVTRAKPRATTKVNTTANRKPRTAATKPAKRR